MIIHIELLDWKKDSWDSNESHINPKKIKKFKEIHKDSYIFYDSNNIHEFSTE